jgi:hypothetical protein
MSALTYLFCAPPATEPAVEEPVQLGFSMGISPMDCLTRRERIAKAKQKPLRKPARKPVRKNYIRRPRYIPSFRRTSESALQVVKTYRFDFTKPQKTWILSTRDMPYAVMTFLRDVGKTFAQIYLEIMKKKRRQQRYFLHYNTYTTGEPTLPILKMYMEAAIKNQRLRTAFGLLARRWIQKRLRAKNEEDLMTGEKPVEPVTIVDWSNRSIYEFEAKTICRDMVSRLLVATWMFFPAPKSPRNPYTNEALTEGQFYSVMKQLRRYGQTHWALEALSSSKYAMKEFERDMYMKLKRTHHTAVFSNPESEAAKEVLLEFIADEHETHDMDYEKEIYAWAAENKSYTYKMHEWRIQCEKYYRIQHFPGENDAEEKEKISHATKRLCVTPIELISLYDAAHEKKYVKVEDRRAAAAHADVIHIEYIEYQNLAAIIAAYTGVEEQKEDDETASTDSNDAAGQTD